MKIKTAEALNEFLALDRGQTLGAALQRSMWWTDLKIREEEKFRDEVWTLLIKHRRERTAATHEL